MGVQEGQGNCIGYAANSQLDGGTVFDEFSAITADGGLLRCHFQGFRDDRQFLILLHYGRYVRYMQVVHSPAAGDMIVYLGQDHITIITFTAFFSGIFSNG